MNKTHGIPVLLIIVSIAAGCATLSTEESVDTASLGAEATGETPLAIVLPEDAFVHHHVVDGFVCPSDEVMVGIHVNQGKVICASLNYDYKISKTIEDKVPLKGYGNQVSSNPSMHGCPLNFWIQSITIHGSDGDLTCVSLETEDGLPLEASVCTHDGRGPNDDGTLSDSEYQLSSPTMHVCPRNSAMRGIHQDQNDLYCCE